MDIPWVPTISATADVSRFLRSYGLDAFAAVGAVIEIAHAPMPSGWGPNSVSVDFADAEEYPIDPDAVSMLEPFRRQMEGQGWETKQRVAALEIVPHERPALRVVLVPTTYEEGTGFHRSLLDASAKNDEYGLSLRDRLARQILQGGRFPTSGVAVVHVVVATSDDRLVLCQRSSSTVYNPSLWSVSYEEQVNQKDLPAGDAILFAAAVRGFQEEFACGADLGLDQVRLLGVFLEYDVINIGFCAYLAAGMPFEEIKSNWEKRAKDQWENVAVVGVPFTLEQAATLLRGNGFGVEKGVRAGFHTSAKYRLLLASISRFGYDAIREALK